MRTGYLTTTKFMSANLPPGPFGKSFTDLLASPALTVLRMAALAASQDDGIDEDSLDLMYEQVAAGELADLAPDIIWRELARGLSARAPSRMLRALRECDALAVLLPEVDALFHLPGCRRSGDCRGPRRSVRQARRCTARSARAGGGCRAAITALGGVGEGSACAAAPNRRRHREQARSHKSAPGLTSPRVSRGSGLWPRYGLGKRPASIPAAMASKLAPTRCRCWRVESRGLLSGNGLGPHPRPLSR